MDAITVLVPQMEVASAIAQRAPDSNLTPRDVDELITVTSEAKGRTASLLKVLASRSVGCRTRSASVFKIMPAELTSPS